MKLYELKQLDVKKLFAALRKVRRDLAVARFQVRTGTSNNTAQIGNYRKTIAQIMTLMSFKKNTVNK